MCEDPLAHVVQRVGFRGLRIGFGSAVARRQYAQLLQESQYIHECNTLAALVGSEWDSAIVFHPVAGLVREPTKGRLTATRVERCERVREKDVSPSIEWRSTDSPSWMRGVRASRTLV